MTTDGENIPPQQPPRRGFGPMGQPPDAGFGCVWVLIIAIIIIILIWIFGWGWRRGPEPGEPGGPTTPGPAESRQIGPDSTKMARCLSALEARDDGSVVTFA